ncbi:MAG: hypothetical protein JWQ13_2278 [Ramlibacter sp.]|nr:hypothetical protein [Ramlibacter sp.]
MRARSMRPCPTAGAASFGYTVPMLEKLPDAVGHALRNVRAGLDQIVFNSSGLRAGMGALQVSSLAFADHAPIPARYTADGEGISPPLQWTGVPANAASLVLIVEDADAPTPHPLVHAIAVDLPPSDGSLSEGAITGSGEKADEVREGRNSYLMAGRLAAARSAAWPRVAPLCVPAVRAGPGRGFRRQAGPRRSDGRGARALSGQRLPDRHLRAARRLDQGAGHRAGRGRLSSGFRRARLSAARPATGCWRPVPS